MDDLLVVEGSTAAPAGRTSLPAAKFLERTHLQEWIIANPQVIGADVLVVTSEYNRWTSESDGATAADRLDVLGLDDTGQLVVVEIKRDGSGRDVHLQAITYAALVSRFTIDTLAVAHRDFLRTRGEPQLGVEEARTRLLEHVDGDLDEDVLRRPRLVLVAASFPRSVTHTAVWLSEMSVQIRLVQVSSWQVGEQHVIGFGQMYPPSSVEEFTLAPARGDAAHVATKVEQRNRARNAVAVLRESGWFPQGTRFRMVPSHGATQTQQASIHQWLQADPTRRWARWNQDAGKPLVWEQDDTADTPTGIATRVLEELTGGPVVGVQGTAWWVLDDPDVPDGVQDEHWAALQNRSLVQLADRVRESDPS